MRILAVHPGADFAIGDVYHGLIPALRRRGHDVQEYRLDLRFQEQHAYVRWRERMRKRLDPDYQQPTGGVMPEIVRLASMTLLEATLTVMPHWVLVVSGMILHPETMVLLHRMGVRTAIVLTESPYDDAKQANVTTWFDVVFTNERASVPLLRRWYEQTNGARGARDPIYLPHAYDPGRHRPESQGAAVDVARDVPSHDVVFVGSGFIERQEILQEVDWDGLGVDFGLYGIWRYLGSRSRLRRYLKNPNGRNTAVIPNETTAALYRNAKVGLNLYRKSVGTSRNATRIEGAESLNPRALELAATGTFHLSDWRPEVEEVFGDLVPTFRDGADLQEQIARWTRDDMAAERERIARLLPDAVAGYTFDARAEQVEGALAAFSRS